MYVYVPVATAINSETLDSHPSAINEHQIQLSKIFIAVLHVQ
jgi:hypothetical protein